MGVEKDPRFFDDPFNQSCHVHSIFGYSLQTKYPQLHSLHYVPADLHEQQYANASALAHYTGLNRNFSVLNVRV